MPEIRVKKPVGYVPAREILVGHLCKNELSGDYWLRSEFHILAIVSGRLFVIGDTVGRYLDLGKLKVKVVEE